MTRRRGLSLVEVLVALFIMGLGAIAILTLFPLGALQMGQALKDDRTAQAAGQADSYMRWYWRHYVVEDVPFSPSGSAIPFPISNPPGVLEPSIRAMEDPNDDSNSDPIFLNRFTPYHTPPTTPTQYFPVNHVYSPDQNTQKPWVTGSGLFPLRPLYPISQLGWEESGPSYPVVIDPMGWVARPARSWEQYWVGGADPLSKLARRTLSSIPPIPTQPWVAPPPPASPTPQRLDLIWTGMDPARASQAQRTCSLIDALTYDQNGVPDRPVLPSGQLGPVQREMRYNWLWVLQKLHQNDPYTAAMTIVVFDKRAHLYVPQNSERFFRLPTQDVNGISLVPNPTVQNQVPPANAKIGSTLVRFDRNNSPPVMKGGWICDVTHTTWTYQEPQLPLPLPPGQQQQFVDRTISAVRNCNFYRVASITDNVAAGTIDIELQVPLKPDSQTLFDPYRQRVDDADTWAYKLSLQGQFVSRTFMYLAGVSEVFERVNLNRNLGP